MKSRPKRELALEQIQIPSDSVFIGHIYVQQDGIEWSGSYRLPSYIYSIANDIGLLHAIAVPYGIGLDIS